MEERKIAIIPQVIVHGSLSPKRYGILLTNKRSIFVNQSSSKAAWGYLLGGIGGAIVAASLDSLRKPIDANADIEELRKDRKNINVRHSKLMRLVLRRKGERYELVVDYESLYKHQRIRVDIVPPERLFKERGAEGYARDQTLRAYAEKMKLAFQKAVPPENAHKLRWKL